MIPWILETDKRDDLERLAIELTTQKIPFKWIKWDNSKQYSWNNLLTDNLYMSDVTDAICLGSIRMVKQIIGECNVIENMVKPWLTLDNYLYHKYSNELGEYMLNGENYTITTFSEFIRRKWEIYKNYSRGTQVFVRPDAGDKPFTGTLVDYMYVGSQLAVWKETLTPLSLLIVAEPQEINAEWRFIVAKTEKIKKIVGASLYRLNGDITIVEGAPRQAIQLCSEVLDIITPPDPIFTIDICLLKDGRYKVVEINSFLTANLYEVNKKEIVKTVVELTKN